MSKITVICVLKSGGDYNAKYVETLKQSVLRASDEEINFICLTDMQTSCSVSLKNNWRGWWSKIEVFQFAGPCIFFDLDTVIIGKLTPLYDLVRNIQDKKIWMLRPFGKHEIMASGIMAWTGDWVELYDNFDYQRDSDRFRGDQDFLTEMLLNRNNVGFIQDHVTGIYSYKYHCREKLPEDARIVCFHGKPRPWQSGESWVHE